LRAAAGYCIRVDADRIGGKHEPGAYRDELAAESRATAAAGSPRDFAVKPPIGGSRSRGRSRRSSQDIQRTMS